MKLKNANVDTSLQHCPVSPVWPDQASRCMARWSQCSWRDSETAMRWKRTSLRSSSICQNIPLISSKQWHSRNKKHPSCGATLRGSEVTKGNEIQPVSIDVRQTATVEDVSTVHHAGRTSWWRTYELHFNRAICDISYNMEHHTSEGNCIQNFEGWIVLLWRKLVTQLLNDSLAKTSVFHQIVRVWSSIHSHEMFTPGWGFCYEMFTPSMKYSD